MYTVWTVSLISKLLQRNRRRNCFATLSFTAQGRSPGVYKRLMIGPEPWNSELRNNSCVCYVVTRSTSPPGKYWVPSPAFIHWKSLSKLLSILILNVTKGQDELSNKQKVPISIISKIWVQIMTFCLNVLPKALPTGQELRSAIIKARGWCQPTWLGFGESWQATSQKSTSVTRRQYS